MIEDPEHGSVPTHVAQSATPEEPKPKRLRLTDAQRLARLEQTAAKLKTQIKQRDRKAADHQKIVIGGAVIKAMREDAELRARLVEMLRANVTRVEQREAIAEWLSAS